MATSTAQPGFLLYQDLERYALRLSREQRGDLLLALFRYNDSGEAIETDDPVLSIVFDVFQDSIDRASASWKRLSAQRSEAGRRGGSVRRQSGTDRTDAAEPDTVEAADVDAALADRFTGGAKTADGAAERDGADRPDEPRDYEEVRDYARANGLNADLLAFYVHYCAHHWTVDGEPVRSWRKLLRAWAARGSPGEGRA